MHACMHGTAASIWNMVAMAVDAGAPLVQALLGLPLAPSMDQPYLSATVQEFWSQRCAVGRRGWG